jgi:hypothetical protein
MVLQGFIENMQREGLNDADRGDAISAYINMMTPPTAAGGNKQLRHKIISKLSKLIHLEPATIGNLLRVAARGDIKLPAIPPKTKPECLKTYKALPSSGARPDDNLLTYTDISVAECIGWTTKNKNGREPNVACRVAFDALLAIDGKRSF